MLAWSLYQSTEKCEQYILMIAYYKLVQAEQLIYINIKVINIDLITYWISDPHSVWPLYNIYNQTIKIRI